MKKTLLLTGVLLALTASLAAAGTVGLNLGWGAFCPTNVSSMINVSDPCDGTTGAVYQLVGSIKLPATLSQVLAEETSVDIQEGAAILSDYWHLEDENQPGQANPAGCRGTAATGPYAGNVGSLSFQVNNALFPLTFTGCVKFWGTAPSGGVNYQPGVFAPNRARLLGHYAKSPGSTMTAGVQYGSFIANIDTNHQINDPLNPPSYVCAGCQDGVCIVYNECIVRQPPGVAGGDVLVSTQDIRRYVTWQGGQGTDCPAATPTHRATWGQVKSLYR